MQDLRVLMVEDVVAEAELSLRQLKASGLSCVHRIVDKEPDFRAALQEFRPHLILSDFTLPEFDGLSALEIAVQDAPQIPFIFVSGTIGEERAIEVLRRGAVDYVLKTNTARLAPAVNRALREVAERNRRRAAERRIRESEQRLRDIIDTAQDWIWELNVDGHFVFNSDSVASILGVVTVDLTGRHFSEFVHEDDRNSFSAALDVLDRNHRTAAGVVARWMPREGEPRWLDTNLLVLLSPDGRVAGFRGTSRDFTERKQQQERIERLTRVLQMQSGINAAVVRIRDRDELLREACRLALQVGGYDHVVVSLVDADGRRARPWYRAGAAAQHVADEPREFLITDSGEGDDSLVSRALRTGEIAVCSDLTQSEPPVAQREALVRLGFKSLVALPLTVDGSRIGVLSLASRSAELIGDEELRLLQDVGANLSFALQYRQKEDTVQFLAYYDPLTGLAKRAVFCERLIHYLRNRVDPDLKPVVVALDINHLGNVNDGFGRAVGDLLLKRVAERLKHQFEDDELLGYVGSGTFLLVLPQLEPSIDNVTTLLESTLFREPFQIEGRSIRASCTSGIARFPADGEEGSTLVQKAEAALKQAKESGEQALDYQIEIHSEIAERLTLEHRLRAALDEDQFVLHYQPQLDLATGRLESVEALLRWNDPAEGLIQPGRFLPVLESSGMIVSVGEWVLRQAARDCRRWQDRGLGPLRIAVNVSALQIRRRTFVDQVLKNTGLGWSGGYGIDLEITETSLLQDIEGTVKKLRELRNAGLHIAIDDFGTGYSSLGLLSTLPVDLLKIDRSFVSGLPADRGSITLVSSIIGLAFSFGLTAVAEGVETVEQLEVLRNLKCHQSQGYLHCRPVPAEQLESLMTANLGAAHELQLNLQHG